MTTSLYSLLTVGADKMSQTDPHGWTLTLISIAVVFAALIILYFLYSLSGNIFSGKYSLKRKKASKISSKDEIAAAIAVALRLEGGEEEKAAIAMALHLHLSSAVHDVEPGFITIKQLSSEWKNKQRNFRITR